MSAITVNAFPPLHAFNSSRGWFLALIVLVHLGFFWGLTHGLTVWNIEKEVAPFIVDFVPPPIVDPPVRVPDEPRVTSRIFVPKVVEPRLRHDDDSKAPVQVTRETQPPPVIVTEGPGSGPLLVEPAIDARFPLSEPEYPVPEIRMQHAGTVWLSVQILPNGRVGAVRLDQSSGYARLDDSAMREARRWRMKPGTQDGVAAAMWKRVPITFRLKD